MRPDEVLQDAPYGFVLSGLALEFEEGLIVQSLQLSTLIGALPDEERKEGCRTSCTRVGDTEFKRAAAAVTADTDPIGGTDLPNRCERVEEVGTLREGTGAEAVEGAAEFIDGILAGDEGAKRNNGAKSGSLA